MNRRRRLRVRDYTVGWICALPVELAAAQQMLDEWHEEIPWPGNPDPSLYSLGRVGVHNVVITCLPAGNTGTNSAATVATRMKGRFTDIKFGLMVGIGGGVPSVEFDIRLGDVVVSQPYQQHGGVVQYDFGKSGPGGDITRTGWLNAPPPALLSAIVEQRARHIRQQSELQIHLARFKQLPEFNHEAAGPDVLFEATYEHVGGPTCELCANGSKVWRPGRSRPGVGLHYGTIASGNQVMKDGVKRDQISGALGGVMCFEMEAAGLMNSEISSLVVRGICDYADSHKNKRWQPYAAATAAACAKEILSIIPGVPRASTVFSINGNETGQTRIKTKLYQLLQELELGYRFPAEFARNLKSDLLDDNITEVDIEENKEFINEWLKNTEDVGFSDDQSQAGTYASDSGEEGPHDQTTQKYHRLPLKNERQIPRPRPRQAYAETVEGDSEDDLSEGSDNFSDAATEVPDHYSKEPHPRNRSPNPLPLSPSDVRETKRRAPYVNNSMPRLATNEDKNTGKASTTRRHRSSSRERPKPRKDRLRAPKASYDTDTRRDELPERHRGNPFDLPYNYRRPREPPRDTPEYVPIYEDNVPSRRPREPPRGTPEYVPIYEDNVPSRRQRRAHDDGHSGLKNDLYTRDDYPYVGPLPRDPNPPPMAWDPYAGRYYDPYARPAPQADQQSSNDYGPQRGFDYRTPSYQMPPQNPTGNRSFHFSTGGGQAGGFNFSNADDIFAEFMKSGGGADFGKPSGKNDESSPVVTVVEKQLLVSLEELFNGTTKRLNLKRKTYDRETGQEATQDRVLELPIKKGLKAGSKIKFSNVGDQVEGGTQDVHFIVAEKPHDLYKRVSDDLHHIVEISLLESLVGWERTVMTIDGKHLKVASKGPTGPTWTERFPSLGMPNSKKPNERGELVIELSINKYPTSLTVDEKEMLMRVLGDKSVS